MTVTQDLERGTWTVLVYAGFVGGRRQQMKRRGFKTERDAKKAEAKLIADLERGLVVKSPRITVERYLVDVWLPAKVPTVKPSTVASYRQMIATCIVPTLGDVQLSKVDGPTLNALYGHLLANGRTGASGRRGGLSAKTVRNVHGLLHRAFADAVRWRKLPVNPCDSADQPKLTRVEMQAWSSADLQAFVTAASDDRLGAAWRLLAMTGMRRGELCGLRWSDVDLDARRLRIVQTIGMAGDTPTVGTPKTAAGARPVAIDAGTVAALKAWKVRQTEERLLMGAGWQGAHDLIVTEPDGTPVHPQVLTRRFTSIVKAAKLPTIRLHDVRHSYATAALAAGVPVKVLSTRLGHADIGTTLRIYAHVLPGDDEAAADLVASAVLRK
jgi:integrase